jgi:phosphohistidine phosphatase
MTSMTTRRLVILRHAKAANPEGAKDVDRPLTDRGHADAAAAGAWLSHQQWLPDLVVCSPSRRTRETWHGVALALSGAPEVRYDRDVYAGSGEKLLELVTEVGDEFATMLLIGHNPSVSHLSSILDPVRADPQGLRTAGFALHTWDGAWVDCGPDRAVLTATHTARA